MLPRHQEGQLSRAKSALVKNETLATISKELGITDLLLWPPEFTEAKAAPVIVKGRVTIAAGAVESLIGAIYLDQVRGGSALGVISASTSEFWQVHRGALRQRKGTAPVIDFPSVRTDLLTFCFGFLLQPILKATAASYKLARGRAAEAAYWHFEKLLGPVP
ncbi:hypothetical protein ON010_g18890 [Phytophthora cinnamomi]|nr:hypothetical protein ON010_g18890 [Phytophthora cinnamomi]